MATWTPSPTKALLVGCNYPGTDNALKGCVADANNMMDLLVNTYGLPEENIVMLVDDGDQATEENCPTKENIEAQLTALVQEAEPWTSLVFYFAGHGGQVPDDDEEEDGYDECIFPSGGSQITDDDLRSILSNLPENVKFTMISDSCHSGSLLDQTEVVVDGPKEQDPPLPEGVECAGCAESNRTLDVCQHLSTQLGCEVTPGNIRIAIACCDQERCSAKYRCIWDYIQENTLPGMPEDCPLCDLFSAACEQMDRSVIPRAGKSADVLPAGDRFITLITGCQSHETSGDTPEGGIMTTTLCNVVRGLKEQDPEGAPSARTVIYHVRELLDQKNRKQNPCLEGSEEAADAPFLVAIYAWR